jgi:plastocyanin
MTRRDALVTLLMFAVACGGGTTPTKVSPQPAPGSASPSPSATGPRVGELEPLPSYPSHVPRSVTDAVGAFPTTMRYAGQQNVQGQASVTMTVIRFGEGHPAFSPTILVGSAEEQIDLVIQNQTPTPHNFSTVDGRVDREVATSKSITVSVTFPRTGYLFFFCKYHLQDQQIGALETTSS